MSYGLQEATAVLKEHYEGARIADMVYSNSPFLATLAKKENAGGDTIAIPIKFANGQARSANFQQADAQSVNAASQYTKFDLTRVEDYGIAKISGHAIRASMGDINAFIEATASEIDGAIMSLRRSMSRALFRDGTGALGDAAASTPTTITLTNPSDIRNFEVGMTLVASAAAGGPGGPLSAGTTVVTGINRNQTGVGAATLTVSVDPATFVPPLAPGDFLYPAGDAQNGGPLVRMAGLEAWLPQAPGAAPFFGVDRTQDVTRLSGSFHDGAASTVEEALIDASVLNNAEDGEADLFITNPVHYAQLLRTLSGKREYARVDTPQAGISFKGLTVHTPAGDVTVMSDKDCPVGRGYLLQSDTWKLYSAGPAAGILDDDGNMFLRVPGRDEYEVRVGGYFNLGCTAPGKNTLVLLAP